RKGMRNMQDRWTVRALLATLLGLGVAAGLARAEQPPPVPGPAPVDPPIIEAYPPPGVPMMLPEPDVDMGAAAGAETPGRRHFLNARNHKQMDCPHRHIVNPPWYCWASHNSIGCGSFKSECTFLFGSCRAFYAEPCLKAPPPPPVPQSYGYGYP